MSNLAIPLFLTIRQLWETESTYFLFSGLSNSNEEINNISYWIWLWILWLEWYYSCLSNPPFHLFLSMILFWLLVNITNNDYMESKCWWMLWITDLFHTSFPFPHYSLGLFVTQNGGKYQRQSFSLQICSVDLIGLFWIVECYSATYTLKKRKQESDTSSMKCYTRNRFHTWEGFFWQRCCGFNRFELEKSYIQ